MADNYKLFVKKIIDTNSAGINTSNVRDMEPGLSQYSTTSEFERKAMNLSNIFTKSQIDENRFTGFNRYGLLDPYHTNLYAKEYLFFTRPDLNIFKQNGDLNDVLVNNNYFSGAVLSNKRSLQALQDTNIYVNNRHPTWNYLLSNQVSSNLDMPSIQAEMTQHNQNLYGISQSFRDSTRSNEYSFDHSLEFNDTTDHDVYQFFKAYNEYCNLEYERDLIPHKQYLLYPSRYKEFSIYKIVVNDFNKIIYYGKHIGVTIKGLPMDSMNDHENRTKITIPLHTFHVIEFNPYILTEINILSRRAVGDIDDSKLLPLYNKEYSVSNKEWASVPVIRSSENKVNGKVDYFLEWRKIDG